MFASVIKAWFSRSPENITKVHFNKFQQHGQEKNVNLARCSGFFYFDHRVPREQFQHEGPGGAGGDGEPVPPSRPGPPSGPKSASERPTSNLRAR